MTSPAVVVPLLTVALTILLVQGEVRLLAIPATAVWFLNPIALLVALLSFIAYPGSHPTKHVPRGPGTARAAMFRLRMAASGSCAVTLVWSMFAVLSRAGS